MERVLLPKYQSERVLQERVFWSACKKSRPFFSVPKKPQKSPERNCDMLPRFQHILVPLDFTAKNQAALDIAFEIASQNRAAVTLLHVIETIEHLPDEELKSFYGQVKSRAETELEQRAQRFAAAGLRVDQKILLGKRLVEIIRDARDRSVDLVVMSSHKVDPAAAAQSMGTLSYQVSILCDCPVLLVK